MNNIRRLDPHMRRDISYEGPPLMDVAIYTGPDNGWEIRQRQIDHIEIGGDPLGGNRQVPQLRHNERVEYVVGGPPHIFTDNRE